ncbi:GMC oxidoreductase [Laccaria amethystina LaAM-08-1]|uniref:GMC oxidoreductase n=1 Tax=Laccaria amethystina LaAM-08-1 TaxID=1095629 RepID=A0A0C9Y0S2_9AGAR|nr:GMC oxidoreductase [Laccaria amethystina LaAM-08-1]
MEQAHLGRYLVMGQPPFTPSLSSVESTTGMQFKTSSRGSDGPLQATYPAYVVPITTNWLPTLNSTSILTSPDAYKGINAGGFFATSAINPSNWTRSSAKAVYYVPASARPNLNVMVNTAVMLITWAFQRPSGMIMATGIESSWNGQQGTVKAGKEVILLGGSVGSPQLSGVGPRESVFGPEQHVQCRLLRLRGRRLCRLRGRYMIPVPTFSKKSAQFLSFVNSGMAYLNGSYWWEGELMDVNLHLVLDHPAIDPQYYSHPANVTIMPQDLKAAPTLGQTDLLSSILSNEISPGPSVSTDEEWEEWLRSMEYHPSL